jgi:hypothetical protein
MYELEQLEQTIFHEIKRTEKMMQDTNLREDTDRAMRYHDLGFHYLSNIIFNFV